MPDKKWLVILVLAAALILAFFLIGYLRPDVDAVMIKARTAFDNNDYPAAKILYRRVIAMTQKHSGQRNEAALFYATCFVRESNYQQGADELRKFLADYPSSYWSPQAYFDLADCETRLGHKPAAVALYQKIISSFSTTSWAAYSKEKLKELNKR
jgi:TolA-binding protein